MTDAESVQAFEERELPQYVAMQSPMPLFGCVPPEQGQPWFVQNAGWVPPKQGQASEPELHPQSERIPLKVSIFVDESFVQVATFYVLARINVPARITTVNLAIKVRVKIHACKNARVSFSRGGQPLHANNINAKLGSLEARVYSA